MPRRRSRSSFLPYILLGLLAAGGAGWALLPKFLGGKKDAYHGLTGLNVEDYRENAKSLQGNFYQVEARVEDQLGWSAEQGRVLSVNCGGAPLGIQVPANLSHQTIEIGQTFLFKVRVAEGGLLVVESLRKS